jgi:hypothetical protein
MTQGGQRCRASWRPAALQGIVGCVGLPFCGQRLDLLAQGQKARKTLQRDCLVAMLGAIVPGNDSEARSR